ncbi:MAG: magnesium transporter [Terrimicrobiaceae bacterium]|nr:magnesium transporter [Terrimicrobiaceae bacterium]
MSESSAASPGDQRVELIAQCKQLGPREAAELLDHQSPALAGEVLAALLPSEAQAILKHLAPEHRAAILSATPPERVKQWALEENYPEGSIGRLMEPPTAVFRPEQTVAGTIEELRELVKKAFITYGWVVDPMGKLIGVITMRDLLFSEKTKRLDEVMLRTIFALKVTLPLLDAMKLTLDRHYPVYPVVDGAGRLLGLVRGQQMFEQQAVELSAQAGSMVGVTKEERLATPWLRSLFFRHPWLQINLFTAFIAAGVVGVFQGTLDKIVLLAVFLPVLAGQSGNTGCQALAVTLRGMTLGELKPGSARKAMMKEALLGFCNGSLVGITAAIGMFIYATIEKNPQAVMLSVVTWLAMVFACVVSGVAGVLVPTVLKKVGADPATASSIFLTTATDVVSMGSFLWLATFFLMH